MKKKVFSEAMLWFDGHELSLKSEEKKNGKKEKKHILE